ncbi:MAG: GTP cyclohydrolase II [Pseudomonadota bacterium]
MSLILTAEERVARARADLRMGAPIALVSPSGGALVVAAEVINDGRLSELWALGPREMDIAISDHRAETLKARAYDGKLARVILSEREDARFVRATADPSGDLATPMKGPYMTRREGPSDLHALALNLVKQARLLPAAVVAVWPDRETVEHVAVEGRLSVLSEAEMGEAAEAAIRMQLVSGARVPTTFSQAGKVHVYRPEDGGEEHYAVEIGQPSRADPVLSRLHSACFTGDVIGSLKCDCGPQLAAAMRQIAEAGAGVLLYMNQEGRGIGLANKMRAYALQDQGFDTVEANHRLGFEDDERDFRLGAEMLKAMGFSSVRLMTNNPGKIAMMEASGVAVAERVPLKVGETDQNRAYLATKAAKSGHLL